MTREEGNKREKERDQVFKRRRVRKAEGWIWNKKRVRKKKNCKSRVECWLLYPRLVSYLKIIRKITEGDAGGGPFCVCVCVCLFLHHNFSIPFQNYSVFLIRYMKNRKSLFIFYSLWGVGFINWRVLLWCIFNILIRFYRIYICIFLGFIFSLRNLTKGNTDK